MKELKDIFLPLKGEGGSVVICTHVNPDGDAIGSSLALKHLLERMGKQATVITPNIFPDFLKWLPEAENIIIHTKQQEQAKQAVEAADLVIVCDLNQPNRLAGLEDLIMQSKAPRILIDHHLDPDTTFCETTVSHPEMCAAAEVICYLLKEWGELDNISREEAICLYCAMMCDTGAFSFNSNRPVIYDYISHLLARGIDKDEIYRNLSLPHLHSPPSCKYRLALPSTPALPPSLKVFSPPNSEKPCDTLASVPSPGLAESPPHPSYSSTPLAIASVFALMYIGMR